MHYLNFNLFLIINIYNTRPEALLATLDASVALPIIMMIVIVLHIVIAMYHDDCLGSVCCSLLESTRKIPVNVLFIALFEACK
jgi:hypothetical protein